jgi:hypothetical protein
LMEEAPNAYDTLNSISPPIGLAEVDSSLMTLGVRIGNSGSACISGDVIRIAEDGSSAVALGRNASAMAAKPLQGIVAAAFFVDGQAHAEWSKVAQPSPSTSAFTPPKPGRKRRHTGSEIATNPAANTESPKPSVKRTYGKQTGTPSVSGSSSSATGRTSAGHRAPAASSLSTHTVVCATVVSVLAPASAEDIACANINEGTLLGTALDNVKEELISKLPVWGKGLSELIGLAIILETNVRLPSKSLAIQDKRRPAPIGHFGKNYRKFANGVFTKFKSNYGTQLWSWWTLLLHDMCDVVGEGDAARPGAVRSDADWSPLLVRGNKGIWVVVVAVIIWRKHMERTPAALEQDLLMWGEFVLDAMRIFKILVDVAPQSSIWRKKRRI